MTYTNEQVAEMLGNCERLATDMQNLALAGLADANQLPKGKAREYITHGVGRRLGAIRRSLIKIFELFPPSQTTPLSREILDDTQIYLQSYILNLYGVFDNWAWSFVYRHGLLPQIGGRMQVSLFKNSTQRFLPTRLREYCSNTIEPWHDDYLKGYRDALAHRIPIYIPPANWTNEDRQRYEQLEAEKVTCIQANEWERLDEVWAEQDIVGKACLLFMHEFSAELDARPVYMHPQLICDLGAVVEFGRLFLKHWHECVQPDGGPAS